MWLAAFCWVVMLAVVFGELELEDVIVAEAELLDSFKEELADATDCSEAAALDAKTVVLKEVKTPVPLLEMDVTSEFAAEAGVSEGAAPVSVPDGAVPDGEAPDGAAPVSVPDGAVPDGEAPDGAAPVSVPDGAVPDGEAPDGEAPVSVPDGAAPDGEAFVKDALSVSVFVVLKPSLEFSYVWV